MSSASGFSLQVSEEGDRITVQFPANTALTDTTAEEFGRELTALAQKRERTHLLVDLGNVAILTSVALSKFIALNGRVRAARGRLTLFNPTPIVRQVFQVTRLDTVLEVRATADAIPA
jgi:anti-anti-sigma factor